MSEQLELTKPVPSGDIVQNTRSLIDRANGLAETERAVLSLLVETWGPGFRLSQRDIVKSAAWLGCHPRHEAEVVANEFESTTRQVRQIIRNLRLTHGIPVLSDCRGYFLPSSHEEAVEYIGRLEAEAKARAAASMVTYHGMKKSLGVTSRFFESLGDIAEHG